MTSDRVLALMSLMREVEAPAESYRRTVRRAAATATDSPQNEAARAQGERALRDIEQTVRRWVARHPERTDNVPESPNRLNAAERDVLRFALDRADDAMASRGASFFGDDEEAMRSLRRLAGDPD